MHFVVATLIMLLVVEMVVGLIMPGKYGGRSTDKGDGVGVELLPKWLRILIPAVVFGPVALLWAIDASSGSRFSSPESLLVFSLGCGCAGLVMVAFSLCRPKRGTIDARATKYSGRGGLLVLLTAAFGCGYAIRMMP